MVAEAYSLRTPISAEHYTPRLVRSNNTPGLGQEYLGFLAFSPARDDPPRRSTAPLTSLQPFSIADRTSRAVCADPVSVDCISHVALTPGVVLQISFGQCERMIDAAPLGPHYHPLLRCFSQIPTIGYGTSVVISLHVGAPEQLPLSGLVTTRMAQLKISAPYFLEDGSFDGSQGCY